MTAAINRLRDKGDQSVRRGLLGVVIISSLSGCAVSRSYEATIVSADPGHVAVKAGINANPGEVAKIHCAKFQKTPALIKTSENLSGIALDKTRIYTFECR